MTQRPRSDPAVAGLTLVSTILLCAGMGVGIGLLVGVPVLLAAIGVLVGAVAGVALVITRYR